MTSLLRRVKTGLSIAAHRKVRGILDGEYTSVFHGRTIEFDDLRPYVAGDEPRDIDWKATARHGAPLVRRYIASRKHTVMLVVDTGRNMAALAVDGEVKRDIAVQAAGIVGYLAIRHADRVGLVYGDENQFSSQAPGTSEAHLERLLQKVNGATTLGSGRSDLRGQLAFVARAFPRRMILLVVADDRELGAEEERLLRRLAVQHEILWLTVGDADLMREEWSDDPMHDVAADATMPEFVRADKALRAEFTRSVIDRATRSEDLFRSIGISSQRVARSADVIPSLFRLLRLHQHARR